MTNTLSREVSSSAPPDFTPGQSDLCTMDKIEPICGDMVSKTQIQSVSEIEVLRLKIESVRENMFPLITSIDSRMTSLEERMTEARTADAKCMNQIGELRHETKSLLQTRTASAQKIDLRITPVADRISKLEEAILVIQNQKPLLEDCPAVKSSSKKSSCKKTRKK